MLQKTNGPDRKSIVQKAKSNRTLPCKRIVIDSTSIIDGKRKRKAKVYEDYETNGRNRKSIMEKVKSKRSLSSKRKMIDSTNVIIGKRKRKDKVYKDYV